MADDDNVIELTLKPDAPKKKKADAERMRELTRIRLEKIAERKKAREDAIARGELPPLRGLRPPTDKEIRERAIESAADLLIIARKRATDVLMAQLDHKDPSIRQRAATKILEYTDGKPTQTIIATNDTVTKVVYETAALMDWPVEAEPFKPGA